MGQLDAFEKGLQGRDLITSDPSNNYKGTTYSYNGKGLPLRPSNDLNSQTHAQGAGADYSTLAKHSIHDLDGKTPNAYQKPTDTSGNF